MQANIKTVFMSRYDLERYTPQANAVLISISDNELDKAIVDKSLWALVSFHTFIDAGYDEENIQSFGKDADRIYADYITPQKAESLRTDIATMIKMQPPLIVVNCQAGRSRSAAVAQFLKDRYQVEIDQDTPDANQTVLRLLHGDYHLLSAIEAARDGKYDEGFEEPAPPARSLFRGFLDLLGISQR